VRVSEVTLEHGDSITFGGAKSTAVGSSPGPKVSEATRSSRVIHGNTCQCKLVTRVLLSLALFAQALKSIYSYSFEVVAPCAAESDNSRARAQSHPADNPRQQRAR